MEGSAYITSESPADVSRRIVEVANVRRLDDFGSRRCYQAKYIVEVQAQFADPAVHLPHIPSLRRRYVRVRWSVVNIMPAADTDGQTAAAHHKAATTERAS
jgi:hypothetical protein